MKFDGERVVPNDMHGSVETYQQHLLRYIWALKYCVHKAVIDAACGTGYGTALLKEVSGSIRGYDISDEALNYAAENYGNYFCKFDLETELPQTISDVVVSFETIEHLSNPKKFLEWCKLTAPLVLGSIPIECPTKFHKHVWNVQQIQELVASIGFSRVDWLYQDGLYLRGIPAHVHHGMLLFVARR